jgi:excisionase family DNA binding protein
VADRGDVVLIPLAPLGVLELPRSVFEQYLRKPEAPIAAPAAASVSGLLNAKAVADALSLPESWIREKERQGEIPSTRVGRYVRFDLAAVHKALSKPVNRAVGHG